MLQMTLRRLKSSNTTPASSKQKRMLPGTSPRKKKTKTMRRMQTPYPSNNTIFTKADAIDDLAIPLLKAEKGQKKNRFRINQKTL